MINTFIQRLRQNCNGVGIGSNCINNKRQSPQSTDQTGFTLVEILVVVVILSIFAGMMSLSVGSSESRKNRAFYEHLIDSLQYVRLLSAERMQPMGLTLQVDQAGQIAPVIVTLSNPYSSYQQHDGADGSTDKSTDARSKNAMELSAMTTAIQAKTPTWQSEPSMTLPKPPNNVSIRINPLDDAAQGMNGQSVREHQRQLQPWFVGQNVPQVVWFGTGEATPVSIEVIHDSRPVGEVITVQPNGSIRVGQSSL